MSFFSITHDLRRITSEAVRDEKAFAKKLYSLSVWVAVVTIAASVFAIIAR